MVRHSEECFLEMMPLGYTCRLEKGGMRKGPTVWPRVTSFSIFLSIIDGLMFAQGRLEYSLGPLDRNSRS